jgi:four helix bundle protein
MEKPKIQHFTDLNAWKESHKLVLAIYVATKTFPQDEKFCLTSQIRRAAISIVSNIAEGFGRNTAKDKAQFYAIAKGSTLEVEGQLLVARDLNYLNEDNFQNVQKQILIVQKLLSGLVASAMNR